MPRSTLPASKTFWSAHGWTSAFDVNWRRSSHANKGVFRMKSSPGNDVSALWKKYLHTRPIKIRNLLVEHYRPLVHMLAARLAQKLPAQISYDEICSAG